MIFVINHFHILVLKPIYLKCLPVENAKLILILPSAIFITKPDDDYVKKENSRLNIYLVSIVCSVQTQVSSRPYHVMMLF